LKNYLFVKLGSLSVIIIHLQIKRAQDL